VPQRRLPQIDLPNLGNGLRSKYPLYGGIDDILSDLLWRVGGMGEYSWPDLRKIRTSFSRRTDLPSRFENLNLHDSR
jgi:hypothetical protein